MSAWRYLETGAGGCAFNMGLDEAILESVASGAEPPTLRLYRWDPPAVSVGYFQGVRDEVALERCMAAGVGVVRRLTGGGAVYHDAELTYSVVAPESHPVAAGSILDSYRAICAGIISGLAELGIDAEFAPLNDVVSGGKKVSGNAQTRKRGCLLQHGTVLLKVDADAMFTVLRVPNEKLKGRLIEDVKARVSSVSELLGREVGYDEAVAAFAKGFGSALGSLGPRSAPSADELARAAERARDRFANDDWTFKR